MKIQVPVKVKWVVTPYVKAKWQDELKQDLRMIERELDQLEFQSKKLLNEASKHGTEALKVVEDRIKQEKHKRLEKKERHLMQLEELNKLEDGDRVIRGTAQTEIEIGVGDNWEQCIKDHEIVIKDGIIIEIK